MLATTSYKLLMRTPALVARMAPCAMATRSFTVGDNFDKKEKVEEDRYMRELERKYIEKKKAEMAQKMAAEEEEKFKDVIAPAMAEVEVLLSKTGDSVSHEALENIAKWKVGH
ncbi:hypothetical protein ACA910_017247 [Epithemia clementina (nom. ined.)]